MSDEYDLQANGNNGVKDVTRVGNLAEFSGDALWLVDATTGGEPEAAAISALANDAHGLDGSSHTAGVSGVGGLRGVHGIGLNRFNEPQNTTGALGEGYKGAFGVTGLSFHSDERTVLSGAAGVIGASNAHSQRDVGNPAAPEGAGVVGLALRELPHLIDTSEPLPLPDPKAAMDGDGTGVWGASGSGIGVHGQSEKGPGIYGRSLDGRAGVLESEQIAQLQLVPRVNPAPVLPASGDWGDLYLVVTGSVDDGTATPNLYLCVFPGDGTQDKAQWAPVLLGGVVTGG